MNFVLLWILLEQGVKYAFQGGTHYEQEIGMERKVNVWVYAGGKQTSFHWWIEYEIKEDWGV